MPTEIAAAELLRRVHVMLGYALKLSADNEIRDDIKYIRLVIENSNVLRTKP